MSPLPSAQDIEQLLSQLEDEPDSLVLREELLTAFASEPKLANDPRRCALAEWFVTNDPRNLNCRTPFCWVDPEAVPETYERLKARWLEHVSRSAFDPDIVRGAALFLTRRRERTEDQESGRQLLRAALEHHPRESGLWMDLGRLSRDPAERLAAFEQAIAGGEHLENLLVWTGVAAFEAGEAEKATHYGNELLRLVDEARLRYGDNLDWPEDGEAFWDKARAASPNIDEARELSRAISTHAYRKHYAHTLLGLIACRDGQFADALHHLCESIPVRPDFRLRAYGPSSLLVRDLCTRGFWGEGVEFLNAWRSRWDNPELEQWIADLSEHRIPEAFHRID